MGGKKKRSKPFIKVLYGLIHQMFTLSSTKIVLIDYAQVPNKNNISKY